MMPRIATVTALAAAALVITPLVARSQPAARLASPAQASVTAAAAPVPAATSVMVSSYWGWPWWRTTGAALPLIGGDCAKLKLAPGTLVGYVQAPSGAGSRVLGRCAPGTSTVTLSFPGLARTGATYTGTATIADQQVAVTVVRSANLLWPLIALIVGIVLALLMLHLVPKLVLDRRIGRLASAEAAIGTADHPGKQVEEFRKTAAGRTWAGLDITGSVGTEGAVITADVDKLRTTRWLSLTEDDAQVKAIDERIAGIEQAGEQLQAVARDLAGLSGELAGITTDLVPAWCAAVKQSCLDRAGPLTLDELAELAAGAQDARQLAAWLPKAQQQVDVARSRLGQLKSYQVDDPRVQAEIEKAGRLLDEALADLKRAATSAEVRQAYEGKFIDARTVLDGLSSVQAPRIAVRDLSPAGSGAGAAGPAPVVLTGPAPPTPRELERRAAVIVAIDEGVSIAALVVVVGLLIFAGLQALAIGKTFGTPWDFVAAVAWGSGAVAIGSPLASAIEGFGQIRPSSR